MNLDEEFMINALPLQNLATLLLQHIASLGHTADLAQGVLAATVGAQGSLKYLLSLFRHVLQPSKLKHDFLQVSGQYVEKILDPLHVIRCGNRRLCCRLLL